MAGSCLPGAGGSSGQRPQLTASLPALPLLLLSFSPQVGEIGKLIDWAHSTSPLPLLGGRGSPAGLTSLLHASGGNRLSFGGMSSPLGDASNLQNYLPASASRGGRPPASASPGKRQLQVASPAGRTPLASPSKMR